MASIDALDLMHLPLETPELAADPVPYLTAAKQRHPWLATSNLGLVITDHKAMREVLSKDDALRFPTADTVKIMGAEATEWGQYVTEFMLGKHGADHARMRSSIAEAFTPRAVSRLRPVMRQTVSDILDEWAPRGAFEFTEFAAQFPIRVFFDLMGADPALVPAIRKSLEVYGASFAMDPTKLPTIEDHFNQFWVFCDELVAQRRSEGRREDLLQAMIDATDSGALTERELRQMLIFLIGAGYDTSKNQLTLITWSLLKRPDIWARCGEDKAFCDKVVEEGLRFASSSNTFRSVVQDIAYEGVTIPKGSMVIFPLSIASRGIAPFEAADDFSPERKVAERHLAFGRGAHICLGQFLARANLEEGLHLIAQRLKSPRLAGEATWRPFPGTWGLLSLPIAFDPAPRPEAASEPARAA